MIQDRPGYRIAHIHCPDGTVINGPGVVKVRINTDKKELTVFIDVEVDLD